MIEQRKATVAVVLDKRRQKSNGTYPVKLRVTENGRSRFHSLAIEDLTAEEWDKLISGAHRSDRLKNIKFQINKIESQAGECIKDMEVFTHDGFKHLFFAQKKSSTDVFSEFDRNAQLFRDEGRIGTAVNYECARKSIYNFCVNELKRRSEVLEFKEVTEDFLKKYENWMVRSKADGGSGNSRTTVGIYLRPLCAIMNRLIDKGVLNPKNYPFGKNKYQIPKTKKIKTALSKTEVRKIFAYEAIANSSAETARDFWIFSYLSNGMNIKDIINLKWSDLRGDKIYFIREKTKRTNTETETIEAVLHPVAFEIIKRQGNEPGKPEDYVFPILNSEMTAERKHARARDFIRFLNEWIKKIATEVGINKNITTYTARHSFSTISIREGAPIELISRAMGHSDVSVTNTYFQGFENEALKGVSDKLL